MVKKQSKIYNGSGTIFGSSVKKINNKLTPGMATAAVLLLVAIVLYSIGSSENATSHLNNPNAAFNLAGSSQIIFSLIIGVVAVLIGLGSVLSNKSNSKTIKKSIVAILILAEIIISIIIFSTIR